VVAHDAAGSALWEATWGPETDQLLEWRDAATGNAYLPLRDNRNSPLSLWGTTEDRIVATAEHTPEGRLTVRDAAGSPTCQEPSAAAPCRLQPGLPFAFASAWRSAASGLVYLRNRWCSPELGEFLGPDPSPFSDSYDSYAYAGGDPINAADPFGTKASYVTSVSGTPGKDPKNAIEDKWLSSRPEYFDPHLTSPRERMQMDQWQRELQAQADAETVRNSMSWFETVIFELSWFTGGNKMAIGWTGENQ